ncbi:glycoside hydrolase family 25 protein [Streptomyces sp. NPDC001089]
MIKGIDVSAYQPATYDTAGLDFVITKITEGLSYTNPRWAAQRDHAKSKGLVWGAYHYPHMANDPVAEADFFLKQVAWKPGDIIVLDWEGYDSANKGVAKSRQLAYRDAWLKHVKGKMAAHRVGMYCNTDYWENVDKTSNCGDFLWIATGGAPAGQPGIKHPWTFHQYSTANDIDHDVANFSSRAALAAWAGSVQEDDPMAAMTKQDVHDAVWRLDDISAGSTEKNPGNKTWEPQTYLKGTFENTVKLVAQTAAITKLVSLIGSGVDTATVVTAVTKAVDEAVANAVVHVSVDVTGTPKEG